MTACSRTIRVALLFAVPLLIAPVSHAAVVIATAAAANNTSNWTGWTAANVETTDANFATTGANASAVGTLNGFGFGIPTTAVINSIRVDFSAQETNLAVNGYAQIALSWDGGNTYTNDSLPTPNTEFNSGAYLNYEAGSTTDTWGRNWTASELNSSLYVRVTAFDASAVAGRQVQIDSITVIVSYTVPEFRYWVSAGTGNWSNASNWSTSSGGTGGAGAPSTHTAVFDGGGGFNGNCVLTSNVTAGEIWMKGSTGTFNTQGYSVTVSSNILQTTGNIVLSTSVVTLGQDLLLTGGTFSAGGSTINFNSTTLGENVNSLGTTFYALVSSNTTSSGLTFNSSFTATQFSINTTGLAAKTTVYFAGGSTFTVSQLQINGTSSNHVVLKSTDSNKSWLLKNTSTNTLSYVEAQRSDASSGLGIVDSLGTNLGNNVNWTYPDGTPPSAPVVTLSSTSMQVYLRWTAPGNDGAVGNVTGGQFQIEYSSRTGASSSDAEYSVTFSSDWVAGASCGRQIGGLQPSVTYYFWIRAADPGGSWSTWSSSVTRFSGLFYAGNKGFTGEGYGGSFQPGDYDGDGDLDIFQNGYDGVTQISELYRNDSGVFTDINAGLQIIHTSRGDLGDMDNDGDLDVVEMGFVISGGTRQFKMYKNNAGTFVNTGVTISPTMDSGMVQWVDYNNDGIMDFCIVGSNGSTPNFFTKIYRQVAGTFTDISAGLVGGYTGRFAWADYDKDGDLDLVIDGYDVGNVIKTSLYRNDGNVFTLVAAGLQPLQSYGSMCWGDFDNDGDPDLFMSGNNGTIRVAKLYRNDGNGVFTDISSGLVGLDYSDCAWGDVDNDGDLDLIYDGYDGTNYKTMYYRNDGGSTFTPVESGLPAMDYGQINFADYDNDGDLDLIGQGGNSDGFIADVYLSPRAQLGNVNAAPNPPSVFSSSFTYSVTRSTLTFKWDGGSFDGSNSSHSVTFQIAVATSPTTLSSDSLYLTGPSSFTITWNSAAPFTGPKNIATSRTWPGDSTEKFGIYLTSTTPILKTESTYYWRVQTIDAGMRRSVWSTEQMAFTSTSPASDVFRYWVSSTAGNWSSTSSWSLTSNGGAGASVPTSTQTVIFDGSGGKNGDCTVDATVNIATLTISGYTGTINTNGFSVTIATGLNQTSGALSLGTSSVVLNGDLVLTGGTFSAGSSTVAFLSSSKGQRLQAAGRTFATVVSSNSNSAGLTVVDSMTASGFTVNAAALAAATTVYFAGGSTATIASLRVIGNASNHVILKSTDATKNWFLNNTGISSATYCEVQLSSATPGLAIVAEYSKDLGTNDNWVFFTGDGGYVSRGSGQWYSTTSNAPWAAGLAPPDTAAATILKSHVVTATCAVTVATLTINTGGSLLLDGSSIAATLTLGNHATLTNNGSVVVSASNNMVKIRGPVSGDATFVGNDIDYNAQKIYLSRLIYMPSAIIGNGETVELAAPTTFYAVTTQTGGKLIQGIGNTVSFLGPIDFAPGTFTKDVGGSTLQLHGNITVNTRGENLGVVRTGAN